MVYLKLKLVDVSGCEFLVTGLIVAVLLENVLIGSLVHLSSS